MEYLVLPLIIAIGFFLRIIPVFANAFWSDEITTFFIGKNSSFGALILGHADPPHNFLYYLLIKFLSHFNTSILFLRAPSLLFALINIFLIFKISKSLEFNKFFGFVCGVLFAFSPFQIEYSWWARMYSMVLFFILLSFYSLVRYLSSKEEAWLFLFSASNVFGFYTDYSFSWYLLVLNLWGIILLLKKKEKKLLGSLWLSNLLVALYLPVSLRNFSKALDYVAWIERPNFGILKATVLWFFGFGDYWDKGISNIWLLLCAFLFILGVKLVYKNKKQLIFFLFAFTFFWIPISLSFLLSHVLKSSIFVGWNLMVASIFPIFLGALVISSFLEKKKTGLKIFGFLILGFILYFNLNLYFRRTSGIFYHRKEGNFFQEAALIVKREINLKNDYLVFIPNGNWLFFDYYFQGYFRNKNERLEYRTLNAKNINNFSKIKQGKLWIIIWPYSSVVDLKYKASSFLKCVIKNKRPYRMINGYRVPGVYVVTSKDFLKRQNIGGAYYDFGNCGDH